MLKITDFQSCSKTLSFRQIQNIKIASNIKSNK